MPTNAGAIRILTVDDHALLRKGIAALLNAEPDMELVAEAANGRKQLRSSKSTGRTSLMDLQVPEMGGIECIIAIRGDFPQAHHCPHNVSW
jgi:DNA-binding NarL/FixJ family response regulator